MSERKLYAIAATVAELSKLTGWHREIFYSWLATGKLKRYRVGTRKILLVADVVEFIRENCEEC
jgi:excisionase family DNA binding protein